MEKTILVKITENGLSYESDLTVEEVIFWLGACMHGAYTKVLEPNETELIANDE